MHEDERVDEILRQWDARRESGEEADPEALIREHPECADALRAHFEVVDLVDRAFAVPGGSPPEPTGPEPGTLPRTPPDRLGDFRILREIGRGGMGVVYEAEQCSMGRRVALKVLSPSITSSPQAVKRFQREARAAGRLHHTNIVPVHAMGEHGGYWFYAMECVQGRPLSQVVDEIKASRGDGDEASSSSGTDPQLGSTSGARGYYTRIAEKFAGVADALDLAHLEGIIHRDIKPSNLLLDADGTLKVVDFGLARLEGDGPTMTVTGALLGTPRYMSPEQAMARRIQIDHRTDIYSFGATLYELLTLRPPFEGDSFHDLCEQIITKDPALPRRTNRHIPRDLETIVLKAMEKDRDRRYRSAGELAKDLRRFAEGTPVRARRIGIAGRTWRRVKRRKVRSALVTAVVLLAATGIVLAVRGSREAERRADLEYARLCSEAAEALARTSRDVEGWSGHPAGWRAPRDARALFARASELRPERHEAALGSALASGPDLERGLTDLEEARRRGLAERTYRLARAHLHLRQKSWAEAERERERALLLPAGSTLDAYFEAHFLAEIGRTTEAADVLAPAVGAAASGSVLRFLALRLRVHLRRCTGDLDGALADLAALRDMGHDTPLVRVRTASIWRRLGKEGLAKRRFAEAFEVARRTGTEEAWRSLCDACGSTKEWRWLVGASEEALRAHPDSIPLLRGRAFALNEIGEPLSALEVCRRAETIEPDSHLVQEVLGMVLRKLGRPEEALQACRRASELASGCPIALNAQGIVLKDLGRFDEALEAFDEALRRSPASAPVRTNRGVVLRKQGKLDEALEAFDRAAEVDPSHASPHANRAALLADDLDRPDEALVSIEHAYRLEPRDPRVLYNRAQILRTLGRLDAALEAYETTIEEDPRHVQAHVNYWELLRELGRDDDARASARRVLEANPPEPLGHHLRSHAWSELERHAEAMNSIETALAAMPHEVCLRIDRGRVLLALARVEEAAEAYRSVLELDPRQALAHDGLGLALGRLGLHEEALAAHAKAIEIEPREAAYRHHRGNRLFDLEQFEEARRAFERARDLRPRYAGAHMRVGCCLIRLRRPQEAVEPLTRAVRLDPGLGHAWHHLGRIHASERRFDGAVRMFERATEAEPDVVDHHVRLGQTYAEWKEYEAALASYQRVIELEPESATGHYFAGLALRDLRRLDEAIASLSRAVELEPENVDALYNLGDLLCQVDRLEEALGVLDRLVEIRPDHGRAHYYRCFALTRLGRGEKAVAAGRLAVRHEPGYPWAHFQLAEALAATESHDEALEAYAKAAALAPQWPVPHHKRACVLAELERYKDALEACNAAIALAPNDPDLHNDRGTVLVRMRRDGEAIRAFREAIQRDLRHALAWHNLGTTFAGIKRYAEAFAAWQQVVSIVPDGAAGHAGRAEALWHLGRHRDALDGYAKVLELDPSRRDVHGCIVSIHMNRKHYDTALATCLKFLRAEEERWWLRALRVAILRALGRHDEAASVATGYVRQDPPAGDRIQHAYLLAAAGDGERAHRILADGDWSEEAYLVSVIFAVLGDDPEAVRWFERAVEDGLFLPPSAALHPDLERLRPNASFRTLLERARTKR